MKASLEKEIRQEMEYTEEICPACANCSHSEEKENLHVDRDWYWVCKFNTIGEFPVKYNGRCRFFDIKVELKK
jgi:hypothetical protein